MSGVSTLTVLHAFAQPGFRSPAAVADELHIERAECWAAVRRLCEAGDMIDKGTGRSFRAKDMIDWIEERRNDALPKESRVDRADHIERGGRVRRGKGHRSDNKAGA